MWSTPAVWKKYNKMALLHFFLVNTTLIYILFSFYVGQTLYARTSVWTSYLKNFRISLFFIVYSRDHQKDILKKMMSNEAGDEIIGAGGGYKSWGKDIAISLHILLLGNYTTLIFKSEPATVYIRDENAKKMWSGIKKNLTPSSPKKKI